MRRREIIAGLAGLLVIAVIGWISYTSSDGLPWQSGYELTAEVPNADRLAPGNEVAVGGTRVGRVVAVSAESGAGDEAAYASVDFELEDFDGEVPADSTVAVRPDSVLGASYLELRPGQSGETLEEGAVIPLESARSQTQLTDLFEIFDEATTTDFQQTMRGLGGGLAGRGTALNSSIGSLADLMPRMQRVSRSLARGETRLADLISSYALTADELGAAAPELAGAMRGGAATFGAIASEGDALTASLDALAPAETSATRALVAVRPALDDLAIAMEELEPAGPLLQPALLAASRTLNEGTPAMRGFRRMAPELRTTLATLGSVTRDPATDGAIRKTTEGLDSGAGLIDTLRAAQQTCNSFTLWAANLGDLWGGTGAGSGPSHALIGLGLAQMGATGEQFQNPGPSPNVGMNYVSQNNDEECEAGNEPYDGTQAIGNPPGLQPTETVDTVPGDGVLEEAREAGLLDAPPWEKRR